MSRSGSLITGPERDIRRPVRSDSRTDTGRLARLGEDGAVAGERGAATVERDGLVFDVTTAGPADGEPVVLLHGFPQSARCWDAVTPRAGRRRACARSRRTSAATRRAPARSAGPPTGWPRWSPTRRRSSRPLSRRPGGRARTSSGTTGAPSSPGLSPGAGPSWSTPSPGSRRRRRGDGRGPAPAPPGRRVVVHGGVRGARSRRAGVRRAARQVVVTGAGPDARHVGPDPRARRARRRPPRRPGRADGRAELVPGDPAADTDAVPTAPRPRRCSSGATATPP